jgi:uncharacterized membrane protein YdcZ (DUF606 family)
MNLTTGPWWMFLGGSIGVVYIAFSAGFLYESEEKQFAKTY